MALPQVHIDNPPRRGVGGGRFMLDLFIIGMLINLLYIYQLFTHAIYEQNENSYLNKSNRLSYSKMMINKENRAYKTKN